MTTTPRLWNSLTQVNTTDGDKNQFESQITPLQAKPAASSRPEWRAASPSRCS